MEAQWALHWPGQVSTQDCGSDLTSLGYHLWTAQIQVDGITVILCQETRLDKHLWVIGTELKKT